MWWYSDTLPQCLIAKITNESDSERRAHQGNSNESMNSSASPYRHSASRDHSQAASERTKYKIKRRESKKKTNKITVKNSVDRNGKPVVVRSQQLSEETKLTVEKMED